MSGGSREQPYRRGRASATFFPMKKKTEQNGRARSHELEGLPNRFLGLVIPKTDGTFAASVRVLARDPQDGTVFNLGSHEAFEEAEKVVRRWVREQGSSASAERPDRKSA